MNRRKFMLSLGLAVAASMAAFLKPIHVGVGRKEIGYELLPFQDQFHRIMMECKTKIMQHLAENQKPHRPFLF